MFKNIAFFFTIGIIFMIFVTFMKNRYLSSYITEDLNYKMVFLGGPRQVGKTTLGNTIVEKIGMADILNWDSRADRKRIIKEEFKGGTSVLFFDEIHKYPLWKNYIKGLYDTKKKQYRILVTGSARLNIYKKGGDSLLGRYHYYRLHGFSVAEVLNINHRENFLNIVFTENKNSSDILEELLQKGGFPEPFFSNNEREQERWKNERVERLVNEDIRDVEDIKKLTLLDITTQLLPERTVSLFSINSLREDVGVGFKTMAHWIDILENFYYLFRIFPYNQSSIKSLKKEPKMFLWDWSEIEDQGKRFENLIACHLLKFVHFLYDVFGHKVELKFLRDKEGREVDFLIIKNGKPWIAIEVKNSDTSVSKHLLYFNKKLDIEYSFQLVRTPGVDFETKGIRVMSADKFLTALV